MRVGTLQVDVRIPDSDSLKAKRKVMNSLKDRIRSRWAVAVAEVGHQDLRARGLLGVATVGADGGVVAGVIDDVLRLIESDLRILVVEVIRDDV